MTYSRWFRFYDSVLDDPKAQHLNDALFRVWVNFMCLANRNRGTVPIDIKSIAFSLRLTEPETRESLDRLAEAHLIDVSETHYTPHNWNDRQFKSDVSAERVKRFRKRLSNVATKRFSAVSGNGHGAFHETAPDTESESDTEQKKKPKPNGFGKEKAASRWKTGQIVPAEWIGETYEIRKTAGLLPIDGRLEAEKFADYWASQPGRHGLKADWHATWRNWVRNSKAQPLNLVPGMGPA